jgi:hypothetical protein
MTKKINLLYFGLAFFLFLGCSNDKKCITVLDENNQTISEAKIIFFAHRLPNSNFGGTVTNLDPFYSKVIAVTDKKGKVCFSNFPIQDKLYSYKQFRSWTISSIKVKKTYFDFESIPEIVILPIVSAKK